MNLNNARPGVEWALARAAEVVAAGKRLSSYVLPPRYGKSDLIRLNCIRLVRSGQFAVNIVVTPWLPLVSQFMSDKDWKTAAQRYDLELGWLKTFRHAGSVDNHLALQPNQEHILVMSAQLFCKLSQAGIIRHFIDHIQYATGKDVAIHVDEGHTQGQALAWGGATYQASQQGAYVFYYTGTPYREDGDLIPGFEFEIVNEEPITVYARSAGSEPHLVRVDVREGKKREKRLVADFEYGLAAAWQEGTILRSSHETIDVDLSLIAGEAEERRNLSELSASEVRGKLGRIVRSPLVIRLAVDELVLRLGEMRHINQHATAIVYCGNDQPDDEGDNFHARKIAKEIEKHTKGLRVGIATMKSEDDAGEMIARYRDERAYDVLIVKQMAGVGLDADHCKVVLDLSSVRTRAQCIQRWLRGATRWLPSYRFYVLITPADVLAEALYKQSIDGMGGSVLIEELETVLTYETEKQDPRDRIAIEINEAMRGTFRDTDKHEALGDLWPVVRTLYDRFPVLLGEATPAALADAIAAGLPGKFGGPMDTSARAADMRREINDAMHEIANARVANGTYDQREYGDIMKDLYIRLYQACGVPPGVELGDINDLSVLARLLRQATIMRGGL